MINNNLFTSTSAAENRTTDIYKQLQQLQNTPINNYRTVFNDISDEWNSCSEDERNFINKDEEKVTFRSMMDFLGKNKYLLKN